SAVRWAASGPEFLRWGFTACRQRVFQSAPPTTWRIGLIAERGEGRVFPELARLAASQPADLYIGHYPDGLAAAAFAARQWGARLGYDAEDFHTGEGAAPEQIRRRDFIQRRYLPFCDHVT